MEIKYPRYTREQDLRCKLSVEDIKKIQYLYSRNGHTFADLARKFDVCSTTIAYWLYPEIRKKRTVWHRIWLKKNKLRALEINKKSGRQQRKRKRDLMKNEIQAYGNAHQNKEWIKEYHRKKAEEKKRLRIIKVKNILKMNNFYITKDIERILGVTRERVRQLRNENKIKFRKVDNAFYYPVRFR